MNNDISFYIILYLTLGMVFTVSLDLFLQKIGSDSEQFTTKERIASILLWPYGLIMFIYHSIKQLRK